MTTLKQMKQDHKLFFQNGKGLHEKYNVYRDHLIITRPNQFTNETEIKVFHCTKDRMIPVSFPITVKTMSATKYWIDKSIEFDTRNMGEMLS